MYQIHPINPQQDIEEATNVITGAFSETPDSDISDWFSVTEMVDTINKNRGVCLKAVENNQIIGVVHVQAENPINGREGTEKWIR